MAKLYAVEKEAREAACSVKQRQQLRQSQSKPIAEALEFASKKSHDEPSIQQTRPSLRLPYRKRRTRVKNRRCPLLFATCKRLGINLRDYLNDVLPKLPNWPIAKVEELSLTRWKSL